MKNDVVNLGGVGEWYFPRWSSLWVAIGFFVLLVGMYFFPSRNAYKTSVSLLLFLPSLVLLLANIKHFKSVFGSGSGRWFLLLLGYLSVSALWGGSSELLHYSKQSALFVLAFCGLYLLFSLRPDVFFRVCVCSCVVASIVSLFWLVDYYYLVGHELDSRFLKGRVDYFGLYGEEKYASFFNPLLLSHTLVFFVALFCNLYFSQSTKLDRVSRWVLLTSLGSILLLLIVAQTRMAWIAASIVIAFNLVWYGRRTGLVYLAIFACVIGVVAVLNNDVVLSRGLSLRPEIWTESLSAILQNPFFGHGMGAHFNLPVDKVGRSFYDTHNLLLALLYYSGGIGVFILAMFLVSMFREALLSRQSIGWFITWGLVLVFGGMADGGGLLERPNEHWFNIVLPVCFMLAYARSSAVGLKN